jgi:hypothetical protein
MPIEAKEAVKKAYEYLMNVSQDASKFSGFRVEEVKLDKNNNFLITLSYEFTGEFPFDRKREYKDFVVDESGKVISMTIRNI